VGSRHLKYRKGRKVNFMSSADDFDPFSTLFEYRLVAHLLRVPDLYQRDPEIWDEAYFRNRETKRLLASYRKLRKPGAPAIDQVSFEAALSLDYARPCPTLLEASQYEDLIGLVRRSYDPDSDLYPYAAFETDLQMFRDHARTVAMFEAIDSGVALLQARQFEKLRAHLDRALQVGAADLLGPKISFSDLYGKKPDPNATLLGDEYLCRGGSMMLVGPSGQGKSSAAMQMGLSWAAGYPAFGIVPTRLLKVLFVQSEDNLGDNMKMATGIAENAPGWTLRPLTSPEIRARLESNFDLRTSKQLFGDPFFPAIRRLFEKEGAPDLLILNPFTAFLGGDSKNVETLLGFLRRDIGALQDETGAAVLLVCHTPKTNYRDTSGWRAVDWIYAAAGGAELSNWVRGIITLDPATADGAVHGFRAAKRGRAIGWGGPDQVHYFAHSPGGVIAWIEATPEQIERAIEEGKLKGDHRLPSPEEVLTLVKTSSGRPLTNTELVEETMHTLNCSRAVARKLIADLVERGKLTKSRVGHSELYELAGKSGDLG
jgi:hypothetical protein